MKSAFIRGPADVGIKTVEKPTVRDGEISVKMCACGICGSDLEKIYGQYTQPSMKLGHEPSGIVTKVGANINNFREGDRVFVHHHVPCNSCHFCTHGNETMCEKYSETNIFPCGLAEEFVVPEWNVLNGGVIKLPPSISFEEAAMIEPLSCCIRAWDKIKIKKDDSVAIFGMGPTGLMHVMLSKVYGLKEIFCFDLNDFRLNFAKKFYVTESIKSTDSKAYQKILSYTQNRGTDIAIVATSSINAITQAIEFVRKGGTVILFGVPTKNARLQLDISMVYSKEITIIPSYAATEKETMLAFNLILDKKLDVKRLITHRFDLMESKQALEYAHKGNDSMKIIITNSERLN